MSRAGRVREADCEVLVLGAGNVGLAAALLLHEAGLEVAVLDRQPPGLWRAPPGFDARVYALNPAARIALSAAGVWQALDASRIGVINGMEIHGDAGGQLAFQGGPEALAHVVEDGALQAALQATLDARLGKAWRHTGTPVGVTVTPHAARVQCEDGRALSAQLLVGADGGHSWLRTTLGWPSTLHDYHQRGVVLNFACERPHGERARQWFQQGEVIALLPLGGQHLSLVWSAHQAHAEALLAGGAHAVCAALAERIGQPLGALCPVSQPQSFPLRLLRVPKICSDRLVLVGDAAHGVHPLAGQGLNLGLGDAANLAAVLAARGPGPDPGDRSLLRRHARQRAAAVAAMQAVTDGLHRLFAPDHGWLKTVRNVGMDLADRAPLLKLLLSAGASGLDSPTAVPR